MNFSNNRQPKVLMVYDRPYWAFHNICLQVQKRSKDFQIDLTTYPEPHATDHSADYDIVCILWYGGHRLYQYAKLSARRIVCVYDQSLWTSKHHGVTDNFQRALAQSHMVLSASPHISRLISRHPHAQIAQTLKLPVRACYDGVDPGMFPARPYRRDLLTTNLRVGWSGNSDPSTHGDNKGLDLIRDACEGIEGVDLIVNDRRGKDSWIPHDEMTYWYQDVDISVCLSRHEGTPNSVLEASSTGRAWISTNVGIVQELCASSDSPPGMIIGRSIAELRAAVISLRDNKERLIRMGEAGVLAIEKDWTWAKKADQFYDSFHEALKGKK